MAMQPALAPRTLSSNPVSLPQENVEPHVLRDLRDHYIPPPPPPDHTDMMQQAAPSSPNDPSADGVTGSADSDGGDGNTDGRKGYGKRELSTSKRAAQNRAAQRAFRQRKEGYIKKLEEQVRDYQILSENFKAVQEENYQLRDYIINLQSRLLESQGEVPPPPSNVDGLQPGKASQLPQAGTLPRLSEMGAVGSQQQPDGLQSHDHLHRSQYPDPSHYSEPPAAKRVRTNASEMTPSQAALQGASILAGSASNPR